MGRFLPKQMAAMAELGASFIGELTKNVLAAADKRIEKNRQKGYLEMERAASLDRL